MQDKHYKDIEHTEKVAQTCLDLLKTHMDEYLHTEKVFSIQYFNSIATLRFCLSQFSDVLHQWCRHEDKQFPKEWLEVLQTVIQLVNSPRSKYPAEYFIKYIVRQHGIQLLNKLKVCKDPSFNWIIPEHLKSKEQRVSR